VQYFEDIVIDATRDHGPGRVVTAEEIKRFAAEFDPMPFHLDEEAAKASVFGRLCASSVHIFALGSQLSHASEGGHEELAVASGLGWDEVRLKSPLFAGDHVRTRSIVESKRVSKGRPDFGIVTMRTEILRADDSMVASYKMSLLVAKRPS
jgi:acyl dehydratase